jgi:hypothetical protein
VETPKDSPERAKFVVENSGLQNSPDGSLEHNSLFRTCDSLKKVEKFVEDQPLSESPLERAKQNFSRSCMSCLRSFGCLERVDRNYMFLAQGRISDPTSGQGESKKSAVLGSSPKASSESTGFFPTFIDDRS